MIVNELTGEVTADIGGKTFRLHATIARLAEFQACLKLTGIRAMGLMLDNADPRAAYHGMKCLCVSPNAEEIDSLQGMKHLTAMIEAVREAVAAGLPRPEGRQRGNGKAPATAKRRGRATGNSAAPSAGGRRTSAKARSAT